jgi:hypothetical protein
MHADPFLNDETFLVAQLSLEENGATGNKGLAGILGNPVLATSVAGLATSATAFAAVEVRYMPRKHHMVRWAVYACMLPRSAAAATNT